MICNLKKKNTAAKENLGMLQALFVHTFCLTEYWICVSQADRLTPIRAQMITKLWDDWSRNKKGEKKKKKERKEKVRRLIWEQNQGIFLGKVATEYTS